MTTELIPEDPPIGGTGTAIVRTLVPIIAGLVLALTAKAGLQLSSPVVEAALVPILGTLYYALVLWLQKRVSPAFGWLLGSPATPSYGGPIVVEVPATDADVPVITDLPDETPDEPYIDRPASELTADDDG